MHEMTYGFQILKVFCKQKSDNKPWFTLQNNMKQQNTHLDMKLWFITLSRRRPVVAIPGKVVRYQWGQFGMRASPYTPSNIDGLLLTSCIEKTIQFHYCEQDSRFHETGF